MPQRKFNRIEHVQDIQVGDILKWFNDKWLRDPSLESKPKAWLCLARGVGNGFWFARFNSNPNMRLGGRCSIPFSEKNYSGFFSHDCHLDCHSQFILDLGIHDIEIMHEHLKCVSIRKEDRDSILEVIKENSDEFSENQRNELLRSLKKARVFAV